jgi:VIT1/CCC1 family predicted Fe2+/Mn2+ transporter
MSASKEVVLWALVAAVLAALAVPWFLWGSSSVVAGLPVWIWWHVGWLGLTAAVFYVFTRRAWGVGVEPRGGTDG